MSKLTLINMFVARITSINKTTLAHDGSPFLDVAVQILKDGESVETKKFGYPLDTPAEVIEDDLRKLVDLLGQEATPSAEKQENEELQKAADATIKQLTDKEISNV